MARYARIKARLRSQTPATGFPCPDLPSVGERHHLYTRESHESKTQKKVTKGRVLQGTIYHQNAHRSRQDSILEPLSAVDRLKSGHLSETLESSIFATRASTAFAYAMLPGYGNKRCHLRKQSTHIDNGHRGFSRPAEPCTIAAFQAFEVGVLPTVVLPGAIWAEIQLSFGQGTKTNAKPMQCFSLTAIRARHPLGGIAQDL